MPLRVYNSCKIDQPCCNHVKDSLSLYYPSRGRGLSRQTCVLPAAEFRGRRMVTRGRVRDESAGKNELVEHGEKGGRIAYCPCLMDREKKRDQT